MTDLMRSLKMHSTPNVQIPDSAEVKFMRAAIKSALVEIERLRTALKPFADIADLVNHTERRDGERVFELPRKPPAVGYFTLVREDFRRAAQALEQKEDKGD